MDDFATLTADERRDIIAQAGVDLHLDFTIVEKDFWVCWTLCRLFSLPEGHPRLVFKGGTSLSKAYGLIKRFSEDIDIVTDVASYLDRGAPDPEAAKSNTQRQKRIAALDAACASYVAEELLPALRTDFTARLGVNGWDLALDPDDPNHHTLLFQYPASAPDVIHSYIRERVKLELGWRSATTPSESRSFRSYVAERFAGLIAQPTVTCTALLPERTFWEKVTALHAESHRDVVPRFFSRHYSDVATLCATDAGNAAAHDFEMLAAVRRYKETYYTSSWARYGDAIRGTLRLLPSEAKLAALSADYHEMRGMFFQEPPPFRDVIARLANLERQINAV